jgi:hypothetical protein
MFKIKQPRINKERIAKVIITTSFSLLAVLFFIFSPVGAAQAATNIYYSVGQNVSDHKTGTPTITIAGGVATFSVAQTAGNMGVGDKISYGSASATTTAYISAKQSTTVWNVITAIGSTPNSTTSATVLKISHTFSSLNAAIGYGVSGNATSTNYMNTSDLVAGNYILNIPCYYDSGMDMTAVNISNLNTDANNYIKIYTPVSTSTEANSNQRHGGILSGTKYTFNGGTVYSTGHLVISVNYLRIEGLQFAITGGGYDYAILISPPSNTTDIRINNNIIKGYLGAKAGIRYSGGTAYVFNNLIYNFTDSSVYGCLYSTNWDTGSKGYFYSNTLYGCYKGISSPAANNAYIKNNGIASSTIPITGNFVVKVANSTSTPVFVNAAGENFHLQSADTVWRQQGVNTSAESSPLNFMTDIDWQNRPATGAWDIGSDEQISEPNISAIATSNVGANTTITWTTDENASSSIKYGTTLSYGSASSSNALVTSHSITLHGLPSYTLYHFRVESRDVSNNFSTSSDYTFYSADSVSPTVTAFAIPSTYNFLGVPITIFTASDVGGGVTGYKLTESATPPGAGDAGWSSTAQTIYTFLTQGLKTLYAWVKDAAGNISTSLSAPVTVTAANYTIGGTISGLTGTAVLQNNNGDNLSLSANGSFTFATAIANGSSYAVTVLTQPAGQICAVSSGFGTVPGVNVTTIFISCANNSVPSQPTSVSAVAGNTQAIVSFTTPASNGGSNILYYTALSSPGNITANGTSTSIAVNGLTNGQPYTFTVTATNAIGSSILSSVSSSTTPSIFTTASIFQEDFEATDFSYWVGDGTNNDGSSYPTGHNGLIQINTEQPHSGSYSFKSTLDSPGFYGANASTYNANNLTLTDPVYYRFYFYVPSTFTFPNGSSVTLGGLSNTTSWNTYKIKLENNSGNLYLGADSTTDGTHIISKNTWHSAELVYSVGAGTVKIYLDGIPDITASGLTLEVKNHASLGLSGGAPGVYGSTYFDDAVVSGAYIGTKFSGIDVLHASPYARTGLKLLMNLSGWSASDQVAVTFNGNQTFHQAGSITGKMFTNINFPTLNAGNYPLEVQLLDSGGTQKAVYNEILTKPGNGIPTVAIDADNNTLINGVKTFIVTPFWLGSDDWNNIYFPNHYANYQGWVDTGPFVGWYNWQHYQTYLSTIGSTRTIGPDGRYGQTSDQSTQGCSITDSYCGSVSNHPVAPVIDYVSNLKDNSNILMWTWADEPELNVDGSAHGGPGDAGIDGPSTMRILMNATHQNDTNHPVILNYYGYRPVNSRQLGYFWPNPTADIDSFDYYPVGSHANLGTTFTSFINTTDEFQRYTFGLTPFFSIIEVSGSSPNATAQQVKQELWLSVIHGIKGISWWHPWGVVPPANFAEMANFTNTATALQGAILATSTPRTVTSNQTTAGYRVDSMVKEDNNYIYVFAARLTDDLASSSEATFPALATQFNVSGMTGSGTATVYGESRTVNVNNGVFTDSFNPFAVHIYQIGKASSTSYTIGGTISGLTGTVVLQNNGKDNLSRSANGGFTFTTATTTGKNYNVTVLTQPVGQTCVITSGSGSISGANVTGVSVTCTTNTFTITASTVANGTVTPSGVTTKNYGTSQVYNIATSTAGYHVSNIFVDSVAVGTSSLTYTFTNITANHTISATFNPNGSAPVTYTIGGTISGLSGGVILQNNAGDNLSVSANGSFTFVTAILNSASYAVTVLTNPSGQTCVVSSGSGTVSGSNVTGVSVTCTTNQVLSGGGGGGGGGGGSTIIAPNAPTNFSAASSAGLINLSWTNPTSNFSGVKLSRKINSAPSSQTDTAAKLIYQGNAHNFTDATTTVSTLYYYSLYSYNSLLYYSQPTTISFALPLPNGTPSAIATTTVVIPIATNNPATTDNATNNPNSSTVTSLIGATGATVNNVTAAEAQQLTANPTFAPLTTAEKVVYGKVTILSATVLPDATKYAIADFIHYGTPTTMTLGAGERGGSVASFQGAFNRLPNSNLDWQDVMKIGNGRWLTQTSPTAEARAKVSFKQIYLRTPNMTNAKDNAAVTVMAYGLRPAQRNTASEKVAILSFKYIYKRMPVSASDWDIVRAIAYSGAKR